MTYTCHRGASRYVAFSGEQVLAGTRISKVQYSWAGILALTCAFGLYVPASAQEMDNSDAVWRHPIIDLSAPTTAGGFQREKVEAIAETERDILVRYRDDTTDSRAEIYIFRAGLDSPTIWGDRALDAILANEALGAPMRERSLVGAFTPPNGAGENSAFYASMALTGRDLASTGVVVLGHDGWLIKIRASSRDLDEGALGKRMTALLLDLDLGRSSVSYPPSEVIQTCPDVLDFGGKPQLFGLDFISLAVVSMTALKERKANSPPELRSAEWCRDGSANTTATAYRRSDSKHEYVAAIGDAGLTVFVGRMSSMGMTRPRITYYGALSDGLMEKIYAPFSKLPRPETVLAAADQVGPIATIGAGPDNLGEETIVVSEQVVRDD